MARPPKYGTRGLCKATDGSWLIDLQIRGRPRYREKLPPKIKKTAAVARAVEVANLIIEGKDPRPTDGRPETVAKGLEHYLEWIAIERPDALAGKKSIAQQVSKAVGKTRLEALSAATVERLAKKRAADGAAPATINRALQTLRHAARRWRRDKWITAEQFDEVCSVEKVKEPPARVRRVRDDELIRILECLPQATRLLVMSLLYSGQRLAQMRLLKKTSVDLEKRVLTFPRTKNNRAHSVPISGGLAAVLESAMTETRVERSDSKRPRIIPNKTEWVFPTRLGKPYSRTAVSRAWERAREAAGLDGDDALRLHDLRREHGSQLIEAGTDLAMVSRLLGHSDVSVTMRYLQPEQQSYRAAVEAIRLPGAKSSG